MVIQRYAWDSIQAEYTGGRRNGGGLLTWPTLMQLSEEYGVPEGTVRNRAAREGWQEQRQAFLRELALRTQEVRLREMAAEAARSDVETFVAARLGVALMRRELQGWARHEGPLDLRDMERIARILDAFHRVMLRAAGREEGS